MKYGFFEDAKREYVITNPKTPVKWTNYVGTLAFGGIVDHTGGSLICKGDPALNRIVKYMPQLPSSEFKGEGMYIRIKQPDGYKIFSPFFVPTLDHYDKYECHVGLGYQRIVSEFYGIRTDVTIFVPPGENVVVRDIKVTNLGDELVELDVVPVVEFTHFDALKQYTNADWVPQTMTVDAEKNADGTVLLRQYAFMKKQYENNFFTSNVPVDSFETDRKVFLGDNEYGTWANPLELQEDHLSNIEARRGDTIAALLHKLGEVAPGETKRIVTQLGQDEPAKVTETSKKFRSLEAVDAAFAELGAFWDEYLSKNWIETPDAAFNSMVNIHNPRQCHTTMNWSRYLSLYQLGLGARGIGFRDSSQDVMGVLAGAPDEAKALMRRLISVQLPNGSAMHQFFPLTMEANEGDSREEGDKQWYGDDHLWIVQAVSAYVKETGDYAFLDEEITFYSKELPLAEREKGTVLEHLRRALEFTRTHTGKQGLPLLGFADWNDTVNLHGDAESVMIASLYGRALLEMIDLMEFLGDKTSARAYRANHAHMKKVVNEVAWDGEWYARYFEEDGTPIGSKENSEGQIYTNAQSWTVFSGFADEDRALQALESVNSKLNTPCGIKLSWPGYDGFDPAKGGVTTYPPGAKENGGIFLHSNPWVMIAETMVGNGDRAFQYYNQINPAAQNDTIERFECEPYCYPQNILGDEHPQFGLARNSWLSGTSSWTYQAAVKHILGLMPCHQGLEVNPCIPAEWDGFKATRKFRGTTYNIEVKNPDHVSKGVVSVTIDGEAIEGNVLPVFTDGKAHSTEVVMGVMVEEEQSQESQKMVLAEG
ncbi:GH36-type glycosyl hydrolase domain-containing protein [Pontiella sulfatireligans]|uniref:Cellobiose phosphorylase n=1 Tax=Pontiella sulfatireligans TaxID=2750658 RepID=A0A6C2UGF3_9BACT|nr:glycosyl transferase [Pontiella sulfatireligans]VGO19260.1 Cellobiose phosphorylase [Pontiella sulfatireligans]